MRNRSRALLGGHELVHRLVERLRRGKSDSRRIFSKNKRKKRGTIELRGTWPERSRLVSITPNPSSNFTKQQNASLCIRATDFRPSSKIFAVNPGLECERRLNLAPKSKVKLRFAFLASLFFQEPNSN